MLFPTILPSRADDPSWAGEAYAFASYITHECLPQERSGTVYVARKRYEDGSTITAVRSVAIDLLPAGRVEVVGSGLIERDPAGATTHVRTETRDRRGGRVSEMELRFDPEKKALVGTRLIVGSSPQRLIVADRTTCVLDPLEAIAFGGAGRTKAEWTLPSASSMARFVFAEPRYIVDKIALKTERFQSVDLRRTDEGPLNSLGHLIYRDDGTLVGYDVAWNSVALPSALIWQGYYAKAGVRVGESSPVPLKGKLRDDWNAQMGGGGWSEERMWGTLQNGLLVPVSVTSAEKAELMRGIVDPKPASPPTDG